MLPYSTNDFCFCLDLNEIGIYQNIANIFCFCQDPQQVWKNIFFTQSDNFLCFLYLTTSHVQFDHLPYLIMIRHSCSYIQGIQSISHNLTTNNTPLQANNIPHTFFFRNQKVKHKYFLLVQHLLITVSSSTQRTQLLRPATSDFVTFLDLFDHDERCS